MFSISTAPAKQSVSDTITILSGRLGSATLLEDRRAAILGLRSFAKDFPASVASGALRSLIESLAKDGEDVDTVKVVLETLLMLFSPNENSPEASDEIVLWLADEFTQRQENITLLLDFLDTTDFYSRLYSLQLLVAILSARTDRTEECVLTAPLGIPRLVAVLDDQREAVRNEAISLLTYLTPTSIEIQKLVAFENAFDKIFEIVEADGSLLDGGRTVEDCLIFLANLLRRNSSNQSLFRESGYINRLAGLMSTLLEAQKPAETVAPWVELQRNRNIYAFLAIVRLFLISGSTSAHQNQKAFWKHGLVYHILRLAFSRDLQIQIRAEALVTCGDMIQDTAALQESFAQLLVDAPVDFTALPAEKASGQAKVYVIHGLLDLALNSRELSAFDLRFAACECLKSYLSNHLEAKLHFLRRAIDGYLEGRDEAANILTVLLKTSTGPANADPYRYWFAGVIAFHLLYDNPTAKAMALGLTEGDASKDEEVVTSMQTISAHLVTGLQRGDDSRILVGYLMLLLGWLFEDVDAVNDFLTEGSNVQSLLQVASQPICAGGELVQGLCAMLLGVAYEFSTKDSPIPRGTLHSILKSRLDRETYLDRLRKLRSHPLLRDFEVTPQKQNASSPGGHADVFFDVVFVNFFKDNYSRVVRAIDRNPEMEISVVTNGIQRGISRELVDSLRIEIETRDRAIADAKAAAASNEKLLHQEQADHRRAKEGAGIDASKARSAYEDMQKSYEARLRKLQSDQSDRESAHQHELEQTREGLKSEFEHGQLRKEAEMADQRATISRLEANLMKANKSKAEELRALQKKHAGTSASQTTKMEQTEKRALGLETELTKARLEIQEARVQLKAEESKLVDESKSKTAIQSELDDLLMVFGDLEEKLAKYKSRLVELGESVSDGEDGEDENFHDDSSEEENDVD